MWLEIFDSTESSRVLPLNKKRLSLGSNESCDIVINSPSVSRKHLMISIESGVVYIMDMGSTNGTFLSDARLDHGRKTEMTTFLPVRLGSDVLITLHENEPGSEIEFARENTNDRSEDETTSFEIDLFDDMDEEIEQIEKPQERSRPQFEIPFEETKHDVTQVISLKELKNTKTEKLVKKKNSVVLKKAKAEPKKKASKVTLADMIGFLAVIAMVYLGYEKLVLENKESDQIADAPAIEEKILERKKASQELAKKIAATTEEQITMEQIEKFKLQPKCETTEEKLFCENLSSAKTPGFGALTFGTKFIVILDSYPILNEARDILKIYNPAAEASELRKTAVAVFLQRHYPVELLLNQFNDTSISFVFYDRPPVMPENKTAESDPLPNPENAPISDAEPVEQALDYSQFPEEFSFVLTIKGKKIAEIKSALSENTLTNIAKVGPDAFSFANDSYLIY